MEEPLLGPEPTPLNRARRAIHNARASPQTPRGLHADEAPTVVRPPGAKLAHPRVALGVPCVAGILEVTARMVVGRFAEPVVAAKPVDETGERAEECALRGRYAPGIEREGGGEKP